MDLRAVKDLEQQRYERLKEIISEYLDDEGQCPQDFLNDLEKALLEMSQYFVGRANAYDHIREFFQ